MDALDKWMNSLVNNNKGEFSKWSEIRWANQYNTQEGQEIRNILLTELEESILFKNTKPYLNHISKGCSICGSGKWSCLFITNKCNAKCFYCPTSQNIDEKPSTQNLDFDNPIDYANYINKFDFKGVSFSGGEPLLYFERTLEYLKTIREKCSKDIYVWMYTNGILVDEEKLKKLAAYNLNEIRFDIGATNYKLDKVKIAKGIIPNITIEIPCIPEEKEKIISMLPEIIDSGVTNLNLHHLRLTLFNAEKLIKRAYTIINAERPLVMESEIAALEIIREARKKNLNIGINYCSFHYKNRFQKSGYRKIIAEQLFPTAHITQNGYLREYDGKKLVYKIIKFTDKPYTTVNQHVINVKGKDYYYFVKTVFNELIHNPYQKTQVENILHNEPNTLPSDYLLFKIWQFEYIENGLREF